MNRVALQECGAVTIEATMGSEKSSTGGVSKKRAREQRWVEARAKAKDANMSSGVCSRRYLGNSSCQVKKASSDGQENRGAPAHDEDGPCKGAQDGVDGAGLDEGQRQRQRGLW